MVDDHKNSPTEGKDIMVPVTVIEIPAMKVAAIRAYTQDTNGLHPLTEVWADTLDLSLTKRITKHKKGNSDVAHKAVQDALQNNRVEEIFVLMHTTPELVSGIPKKVPDLMEVRVAGGQIEERYKFALDLLGKEVATLADERYKTGSYPLRFDASCLPSGTYTYRIQMGDFMAARKMVLLE
jgi:large subunit ribosomal protein L3